MQLRLIHIHKSKEFREWSKNDTHARNKKNHNTKLVRIGRKQYHEIIIRMMSYLGNDSNCTLK